MATLREQLMELVQDSNDGFFELGMQIVPGFTRRINPINYFGIPVTCERSTKYDEKFTGIPDVENFDEKDAIEEQESQASGLKINAFWSENDRIKTASQTASVNGDTNKITDVSETLDGNEQDASIKDVSEDTVKSTDTVADVKSNPIWDNTNAPFFPLRCKDVSSDKTDVSATLGNCVTKDTMPDASDTGSSFYSCIDADDASVQSQLDVQDSQVAATTDILAPRTNINEFLQIIARCSPISDVLSYDSNDSKDVENELDSEQDIEEFIINPLTDRKGDRKKEDTIKNAGVGTADNTYERQEVEKTSDETYAMDIQAHKSIKYEHLPPHKNQELESCDKSKLHCNDAESENVIVISLTEELMRSKSVNNKEQSELLISAVPNSKGAEGTSMSYTSNTKSDPHELSKHCNPVIEIINDTDGSEADEIDTNSELGFQLSECEKGIQEHNSENMLFRNIANARLRNKPVDVPTNDSEACIYSHKEKSQNLKAHISKNKEYPQSKKVPNAKVHNTKKITGVRDKNLFANIRKGEKTVGLRKSFLAKKQADSIKDFQNVKARNTTDMKSLSTGNPSGKRQMANGNENKLTEVNGHDQTKVRSPDIIKRKLKENRPSPEAKKMRLNDHMSSQMVGKESQKPKLRISGEVAVNEIHRSNEIKIIKKSTLFSESKDIFKSEKVTSRSEGVFKPTLNPGEMGENDTHKLDVIRGKYQSSDKLLQVSGKINKRRLVDDKGNTAAQAKRKMLRKCLAEQKSAEIGNPSLYKEPIPDRIINKNDNSLQATHDNLSVSRSGSNMNIHGDKKFISATKSERKTVTIGKSADQVLSDVMSSFQSSKYKVQTQNDKGMEGRKLFKASVKGNFSETRPSSKKMAVRRKFHSEEDEKKQTSKSIENTIPKPEIFDNGNPPKNNKELLSELQDYIENVKKQVFVSLNKDVREIRYQPNFSPYYRCYICSDLFFSSQERLDSHKRVSHNIEKRNSVINEETENELMTSRRNEKVLEKDSVDKDVWSESGNPESVRRVLSTLIVESNLEGSIHVESEMEKTTSNAKTKTHQDSKLKKDMKNSYSVCHRYEKQVGRSLVCRDTSANEGQTETRKGVSGDIQEEMQTEEVDKQEIKENKHGTPLKNPSANKNLGGIVTCTGELKDDDDDEINQSARMHNYEKEVVSDKTDKTSVVSSDTKRANDGKGETSKKKISESKNLETLEAYTTELKDFDDTIGNNQIERHVHDKDVVSNETKPKIVNCHTKLSSKDKEEASKERKSECRKAGGFKTKTNKLENLQDTRNNYRCKKHFLDNVLISDENDFSKTKIFGSYTAQVEDNKEETQEAEICDGIHRSPSILKHVSDNKYVSKKRDNDDNTSPFLDGMVSEKSRMDNIDNIKPLIKEKSHRLQEHKPTEFKSSESIVTNSSKTTETNDKIRSPCLNKTHVQVKTAASQEGMKTGSKMKSAGIAIIQLKTQKSSKAQHRKTSNSKNIENSVRKTQKETITVTKCMETDYSKEVKDMTADRFADDVPEVGEPVENEKYDAMKETRNTKGINKSSYVCDDEKINAENERKDGVSEHLVTTPKQKEKNLSGDSKDSNGKTVKAEKLKQVAEEGHRPINLEIDHERLFDNVADDNLDETGKYKIEATGSLHAKRLLKLSEDSDSNSMRAHVDSMSSLDSLTSYLEFEADINLGDLNKDELHAEKKDFHKNGDGYRQNEKIAVIPKDYSTPRSFSKERTRRSSEEGKYEKCKHCTSRDMCSHCLSDNRKRRHNSGSSKASDRQSEKHRSRRRSGSSESSHKSPTENNDRKSDIHCYRRSPKRSKNESPSRRHGRHKRRRSRSRDRYRYHDSNKKNRERELKAQFIEMADCHQKYGKSHCRCDSCRKSSTSIHSYKCLENDTEIPDGNLSKCTKIPQKNVTEKQSPRKCSSSFRERIHSVRSSNFKPSTKRRLTLRHTEKEKYLVKIELDDKNPHDSTARLGVDKSATESSENEPDPTESSPKEKINESASEVNDKSSKAENTVNGSLDIKQKALTHELTLCNTCDIKFGTIHDLRRHLYKEHEDVSKCVECRLGFVTIVGYDDHVAEKHANVKTRESTVAGSNRKRKEEIQSDSSTPIDDRHVNNDETRRRNHSGRKDKPIDYQRFCRICRVEFYTRDELVDHLWDKHGKRVQRFPNERDNGPQKLTHNFAEYRRPMEGYDHSLTCRICYLRLRSKDELFHHLDVKHNIGPKAKTFERQFSPKGLQRL